MPFVGAASGAGEISRAHVQAIADAYTPERVDVLAPLEPEFVNVARTCERAA